VVIAGVHYNATPTAVGNRLGNFSQATNPIIWNAHEWDVRS
jgi:hypothetical protein